MRPGPRNFFSVASPLRYSPAPLMASAAAPLLNSALALSSPPLAATRPRARVCLASSRDTPCCSTTAPYSPSAAEVSGEPASADNPTPDHAFAHDTVPPTPPLEVRKLALPLQSTPKSCPVRRKQEDLYVEPQWYNNLSTLPPFSCHSRLALPHPVYASQVSLVGCAMFTFDLVGFCS